MDSRKLDTIRDKQYHKTAFPLAHMQHHCAVKRNPRGGFQWEYCNAVAIQRDPDRVHNLLAVVSSLQALPLYKVTCHEHDQLRECKAQEELVTVGIGNSTLVTHMCPVPDTDTLTCTGYELGKPTRNQNHVYEDGIAELQPPWESTLCATIHAHNTQIHAPNTFLCKLSPR